MADSVDELAANMRIPTELFAEEWRHVETLKKRGELDRYERRFFVEQHLMPPFCAVKVSGALFHTQGGSWSMPPVA
jgi:fumarate reductase flavoprotein subunit